MFVVYDAVRLPTTLKYMALILNCRKNIAIKNQRCIIRRNAIKKTAIQLWPAGSPPQLLMKLPAGFALRLHHPSAF